MENPPPNDLNANLPEDEPVQSEHAPIMLGFAPAMLNIPNNNNGWIEEDDEEEIEAEEDDEEEIEAEDDNEMDVKVDDDENDAEIIHPYEEADPLNRSPLNAPARDLSPLSLILPYAEFFPLDLWEMIRTLFTPSFDDDLTALDSTLREQIQEMKKLMAELNEQWESKIRDQLPPKKRYRETPYDPSTDTTPRPWRDDPYVMARDAAAIVPTKEDDEDPAVPSDPQIMPPRRAQPLTQAAIDKLIKQRVDTAIAVERERVRNARPAEGPA
ncbi:hypothetical protein Tco_1193550 [Tanacetum coccineum]